MPVATAHGNFTRESAQEISTATRSVKIEKCTHTDQKIDLNNANLVAFMDCPGFYPTLAQSIVKHAPYAQVEEVLEIADLSAQQKQMLKENLSFFQVSDPVTPIEMRMPPRPSMRANP